MIVLSRDNLEIDHHTVQDGARFFPRRSHMLISHVLFFFIAEGGDTFSRALTRMVAKRKLFESRSVPPCMKVLCSNATLHARREGEKTRPLDCVQFLVSFGR